MAALVILSLGGLWTADLAAGLALARAWRRWLPASRVALAAPAPDILVARDAATVAVRGSDGLLRFVRPARDDYSAGEWLKRDGDGRDSDAAVATPEQGVRCDAYGCIAKARDGSVDRGAVAHRRAGRGLRQRARSW